MAFSVSTTYRLGAVLLLLVGLLTIHSHAQQSLACDADTKGADVNLCESLVASLEGSYGVIPDGQQSICKVSAADNEQCCVTWKGPAPGATGNDLYASAAKVFNQCQSNGLVAGFELRVQLHGTQVIQCLSNSSDPSNC